MTTLGMYNLKGGVGKTATTVNLAYLSAADGLRTLVWDLDAQGASSYYLQAAKATAAKKLFKESDLSFSVQDTEFNNLWIIPSDLSVRNADLMLNDMKKSRSKLASLLSSVKKDYDVVFLDCPAGISLLHENIFTASDWLLVPNIPTTLSIRSYETVKEYFDENGLDAGKIKCFFSMVDHRKNLHHETMQAFYKDKLFFKNYIPYLSDVEKMGVHQSPLFEFANSSYAAQCFRDLWKEVKKVCLAE